MMISSQRHLDADTVNAKSAAQDYTVTIATVQPAHGRRKGTDMDRIELLAEHTIEFALAECGSFMTDSGVYEYAEDVLSKEILVHQQALALVVERRKRAQAREVEEAEAYQNTMEENRRHFSCNDFAGTPSGQRSDVLGGL